MSIRLSSSGRTIKSLLVRVDSACSAAPHQVRWEALEFATTRIHRHGRFSDGGVVEGNTKVGATVLNFRASVKGRVGRSTARGTLRLRGTVKDSAGKVIDKCDSGVVKWILHRGHYYGGGTDAGIAVSVRTNRSGRQLKSFYVDFLVTCGSQTDIDSRKHLHVTVGSDGRFSKEGTLRFKAPQGPTVEGQFELKGRLKSGKASGTYRGSGQAQLSDGSSLTCDTGTIKWSARRS